eukprot:gene17293-22829_t
MSSSRNAYGHTGCKSAVWEKARTVRGKDPDLYRRDPYGNVMYKSSYGKDSKMGWSIDHKIPSSHGGSDALRNLQALNSTKNKSLGNNLKKRK